MIASYRVTFDMPLRLRFGDRPAAIAGRLDEALHALGAEGVTDPELATYRVGRGRVKSVSVVMTVGAADAVAAAAVAMAALRHALGDDARAWDVAATSAVVVPVGADGRPVPLPQAARQRPRRIIT